MMERFFGNDRPCVYDKLADVPEGELRGLVDTETICVPYFDSDQYHDYLHELISGEVCRRTDNKIQRRIKSARFPVIKTLENFDFSWPQKINPQAIKDLFGLRFLEDHSNVILMGGVGLGKTHLACSLGYQACLNDH